MNICWINEAYKESNRIFDSFFEVQEWVESLYPDFSGGWFACHGYASPDQNVHTYLSEQLTKWILDNKVDHQVKSSIEEVEGKVLYKIWVTPIND